MKHKTIFEEAEDVSLPSSEDEESTLADEDTETPFALEQIFSLKYKIGDETSTTLGKEYILNLCQDSAFTRIAAGLSNATVQIFDINNQSGLTHASSDHIPPPTSTLSPITICGVRFLDETSNCLLVGTTNGQVRLFDLRSPQREQALFESTDTETVGNSNSQKSFTCFDRNSNGRIICAGTEQLQNEVYLLFFDVRDRKQLGGYFESHQDDVTAVRFHATNPDILCTGSTDGLINIFDIKESCEDDALLNTINTENSVHKLNWHKNVYDKDIISCITHTNDLMTYDSTEGDLIADLKRADITKEIKRSNPSNCNLIDVHNMADNSTFLLAGTNSMKGEIMRSLLLQNKKLQPLTDFSGNKQIVRESLYDAKSSTIITAGESGIISLWTPQVGKSSTDANVGVNKLKAKSKKKSEKKAPY